MQRKQELLLNDSAEAGMRNPVATAMRTMPFRRRIDPFHSLESPGQLLRLSIPRASLGLGPSGSHLCFAQSNRTAQEIF